MHAPPSPPFSFMPPPPCLMPPSPLIELQRLLSRQDWSALLECIRPFDRCFQSCFFWEESFNILVSVYLVVRHWTTLLLFVAFFIEKGKVFSSVCPQEIIEIYGHQVVWKESNVLKRRLWPEFERQESLLILSTSNLTLQSDINSKTPKSTFHGSPRPLKLNNEPFKMFGSWVYYKSNATFRVKIFFFNPVHGIREAPHNFLHFLDIRIATLP